MEFLVNNVVPILVALLVFSLLVVVHELGHFFVAKKCGVCVEEFSVGMGPVLFSKQFGETSYSVRIFPIGGFCRMLGEDEDSNDSRAFGRISVWKRIAVIAAGPFMNFVFALLVIVVLLGRNGYVEPIVADLVEGSGAAAAGIQPGDRIIAVDDAPIRVFQDLSTKLYESDGSEIKVAVKRENQIYSFSVKPTMNETTGQYIVGFQPLVKTGCFGKVVEGYEKAEFSNTVKVSVQTMSYFIRLTVSSFIKIFTFSVPADQVSGPIGIIEQMGDTYQESAKQSMTLAIENMASIAALLSANLGAINLFPIPAMDGGRLVFLFLELIRKKPISPEKEGFVHFIGFALLMTFMLFIAFNDVSRIFTR